MNQNRNAHGIPITFNVLGIEESPGFDSSVRSFAANIGFDAAGVDLRVSGGSRQDLRNGFSHYSGFPASSTPGQVSINERRRFVILDGREGPQQWQLLYSSSQFNATEAAAVRQIIDGLEAGGDPSPEEFDLTVSASPQAGGAVSGSGRYASGGLADLSATPAAGYRFGGWVGEGVVDASSMVTQVVVDADKMVTASFIKTWEAEVSAVPEDGGTVSGGGVFDEGSEITLQAVAADGFRFSHWSQGETVLGEAESLSATLGGDATFTAHFVRLWNLEILPSPVEGGAVSQGGLHEENAVVEILASPAEGYRFAGWQGEGIADPLSLATSVTMDGARSVRASFVKVWELSVSAIPDGSGAVSGGGVVDEGQAVEIVATAAEGFRFVSWQGAGVADPLAPMTTVTLTANLEVGATFVRVRTLSVNAALAEGGSVLGGGTYDEGQVVEISATPAEGYRFVRWEGAEVADPASMMTTVTVTGDAEVEAVFVKVWELAVEAGSTEGGSVVGAGIYDEGEVVKISATPAEGYRFVRWEGAEVADPASAMTTVTVMENLAIEATFVRTWRVSFSSEPEDGGVAGAMIVVDDGEVLSLSAVPNEGYRFAEWAGGAVVDPAQVSTSILVTRDTHLVVRFVRLATLKAVAFPESGGTVEGGGVYDVGAEIGLMAFPAEGYRFERWEGENVAEPFTPASTVSVDGDRTVTATFVKQWNLALEARPAGGGEVTGAGLYDEGAPVTISAVPAEGFRFLRWVGDEMVSGANTLQVTVTLVQPTELAAEFAPLAEDEDGDGIRDAWERENGLDPEDPEDANLDADADGQSNLEEFVALTDPRDPFSVLRIDSVHRLPGNAVEIGWASVPGVRYAIEVSENLAFPWQRGEAFLAEATTSAAMVVAKATFFRVIVLPETVEAGE